VKYICFLLSLAALPGFSQDRQGLAPIALYTHFDQAPSGAVAEAMHNELAVIMAPMGLQFEWRSLDGVRGDEVAVELAVVTFKGRCDVGALLPRTSNPGALGWTHVSDGAILPFSDVDCDRIRAFVQRDLLTVRAAEREEAFGRALARVVAHELYHIFANTGKHGSCGVAKSAYTVGELLSDEFVFEGRELQVLRTSKTHIALEIAAHSPSID
jgi:hypothetical protein